MSRAERVGRLRRLLSRLRMELFKYQSFEPAPKEVIAEILTRIEVSEDELMFLEESSV